VPTAVDVTDLVDQARRGDPRGLARLISLVEDASPLLRQVAAAAAPYTGHARVIGITGAPGVGKSTTTSALVSAYRKRQLRVGVLAVDPSSPFTGGALLGDRVRMQEHATDPMVFIRSMASRGHLGGLAWSTPQALRMFDIAGCDVVLLETVGVGQSEVDLAPGMGDSIQTAKAGILEIGDVYVVNKADRDGVEATTRELRHMVALGAEGRQSRDGHAWAPQIVRTVASSGQGVDDLVSALDGHHEWLVASGRSASGRQERAAREIEALALDTLRGDLDRLGRLGELAAQVADGVLDAYTAADQLLSRSAPEQT
jgi:LAO/AO transport system kinase